MNSKVKIAVGTGAVVVSLLAGSAQSATAAPVVSSEKSAVSMSSDSENQPTISVNHKGSPTEFRILVTVPQGARLVAADRGDTSQADTSQATAGNILVVNSQGRDIGSFDGAWAADRDGKPVRTTYKISGNSLVQKIYVEASTAYPVTSKPIYSPISSGLRSPAPLGWAKGKANRLSGYVGVPSNYIYNPRLGARHDYCTGSPDEFPAPIGNNADFRGPCARHDMCYDSTTSKWTCDNRLFDNMVSNCDYWYSWYNPNRLACRNTAFIYWTVVVAGR